VGGFRCYPSRDFILNFTLHSKIAAEVPAIRFMFIDQSEQKCEGQKVVLQQSHFP
jgi:hypothetical protein